MLDYLLIFISFSVDEKREKLMQFEQQKKKEKKTNAKTLNVDVYLLFKSLKIKNKFFYCKIDAFSFFLLRQKKKKKS